MQLSLLEILILAVVQGVTEFLPISSSGHLVVLGALLSPEGVHDQFDIAELNIVLHGGTLGSILVFYWQRVGQLLGSDRRVLGQLVVATLPAVVVGLPIKLFASDTILSNPLLAGCCLVITGILLHQIGRMPRGSQPYQTLTYAAAFGIGMSQAAAILPGLSRSGATISTGMRLGLSPTAAATFSFLLAIPAIGGACVLELGSIWMAGRGSQSSAASPISGPMHSSRMPVARSTGDHSPTDPLTLGLTASLTDRLLTHSSSSPVDDPRSISKRSPVGPASTEDALQPLAESTTARIAGPSSPAPATRFPTWHLACGAFVSFIVGLGSLLWLQRWIERNQIGYFAYWCIPLGMAVVLWQLLQ